MVYVVRDTILDILQFCWNTLKKYHFKHLKLTFFNDFSRLEVAENSRTMEVNIKYQNIKIRPKDFNIIRRQRLETARNSKKEALKLFFIVHIFDNTDFYLYKSRLVIQQWCLTHKVNTSILHCGALGLAQRYNQPSSNSSFLPSDIQRCRKCPLKPDVTTGNLHLRRGKLLFFSSGWPRGAVAPAGSCVKCLRF